MLCCCQPPAQGVLKACLIEIYCWLGEAEPGTPSPDFCPQLELWLIVPLLRVQSTGCSPEITACSHTKIQFSRSPRSAGNAGMSILEVSREVSQGAPEGIPLSLLCRDPFAHVRIKKAREVGDFSPPDMSDMSHPTPEHPQDAPRTLQLSSPHHHPLCCSSAAEH